MNRNPPNHANSNEPDATESVAGPREARHPRTARSPGTPATPSGVDGMLTPRDLVGPTTPGSSSDRSFDAFFGTNHQTSTARLDHRFALVVDDHPTSTFQLGVVLRDSGARVSFATDERQAIELMERNQRLGDDFDFAIIGMNAESREMSRLPLDGHDVVRRLRDAGFVGPVIGVVDPAEFRGCRDEHEIAGLAAACHASGCDDVLMRPVNVTELREVLSERLNSPQSRSYQPVSFGSVEIDTSLGNAPGATNPENRLLQRFVEKLPQRLTAVEEALRANDLLLLETVLEQFKQSADAHGYRPLGNKIRQVEQRVAESERDLREISEAVETLMDVCRRGTFAEPPSGSGHDPGPRPVA